MDSATSQRGCRPVRVRVRRNISRPVPWLVSLLFHGGLVGLLWLVSNGVPAKTPSAYDQLIKGKEAQIVFYKFKDKLPDVRPAQSADARPAKAEIRIPKQSIVSSPKNAVKGLQMVWQPVPDILPKDVPSPNILAIKAPPIAAPERKQFVPPADRAAQAKATAQPKLPDAPRQLAVQSRLPDQLGAVPKLTAENRVRFVAPEARAKRTVAQVAEAGAAPALASSVSAASPLAGIQAADLNIAVVGLNPSEANAVPKGSRAAEFSAGPVVRPEGGTGGAGTGVAVPDLYVSGGGPAATTTLMARLNAAPTSAEALRGMSKYAGSSAAESAGASAPRIGATRVSSAPTPRFDGREVYTLAIQMPNITSYVGSWLMWYSGREAGAGAVVAPVPHRKVDPKYIAQAAEERVEGKVQLLCVINREGHVDRVELVRGIDDRLNRSAMEALAKWEFSPALRGGEPVDVDVFVEIPFKLAPRSKP